MTQDTKKLLLEAADTIRGICSRHRCSECPFGRAPAIPLTEDLLICHLVDDDTIPMYWDIPAPEPKKEDT